MYDIFFDLNDMHQAVQESDVEPDDQFWMIGDQFDFDFIGDLELPELDDYPVIVKKYGCTCSKCGEFYPYAEQAEAFKCWSCRNF